MPSTRKADKRRAKSQAFRDDYDDEAEMATSDQATPINDQEAPMDGMSFAARLAPYSEKVESFLGVVRALEPNLAEIKQMYAKHVGDIASVEEIHEENEKLKCEVGDQKREIDNLQGSMASLYRSNDGAIKEYEEAKREYEAKQIELATERLDFEETAAEREQADENRWKMRAAELENEHEDRQLALEHEFQQKWKRQTEDAEKSQRAATSNFQKQEAALAEQKRTLENQLQKAEEKNQALQRENGDLVEKIEDMRRLKSSLRAENQDLAERFDSMNAQFSCHSRSVEEYQKDFEVIEEKIKRLSEECPRRFDSEPLDELDAIRLEMEKEDTLFCAVPISRSEESVLLIRAHIQRVIASHIVRNIWKPFSCDGLLDQPKVSEFLLDLQNQVMASTHGGSCQEVFWRVQTSQACQQANSTEIAQAQATAASPTTKSKRLTKTESDIEAVLRPLIEPQKSQIFVDGLRSILSLALDVWDEAATDEKAFEAELVLSLDSYVHCRAIEFDDDQESDDVLPSDAASITDTAVMFSPPPSYGHLLTLFPRIQSRLPMNNKRPSMTKAVPGEFPREYGARDTLSLSHDQQTIETIHAGRALSDDSLLAREGREEVQKRATLREKEIKAAENRVLEMEKTHIQTRRKSTAVRPLSTEVVAKH